MLGSMGFLPGLIFRLLPFRVKGAILCLLLAGMLGFAARTLWEGPHPALKELVP